MRIKTLFSSDQKLILFNGFETGNTHFIKTLTCFFFLNQKSLTPKKKKNLNNKSASRWGYSWKVSTVRLPGLSLSSSLFPAPAPLFNICPDSNPPPPPPPVSFSPRPAQRTADTCELPSSYTSAPRCHPHLLPWKYHPRSFQRHWHNHGNGCQREWERHLSKPPRDEGGRSREKRGEEGLEEARGSERVMKNEGESKADSSFLLIQTHVRLKSPQSSANIHQGRAQALLSKHWSWVTIQKSIQRSIVILAIRCIDTLMPSIELLTVSKHVTKAKRKNVEIWTDRTVTVLTSNTYTGIQQGYYFFIITK